MLFGEGFHAFFDDLVRDVGAMGAASDGADVVDETYLLKTRSILQTKAHLPPIIDFLIQIQNFVPFIEIQFGVTFKIFYLNFFAVEVN